MRNMRKTKIVCTLGPASEDPAVIEKMVKSGMNVARLNFSHGTHESHKKLIDNVRAVSEKLNVPIAILQDLGGPKIRLGPVPDGPVYLAPGSRFTLYEEDVPGDVGGATVTYKNLWKEISSGKKALIDDGLIELTVESVGEGKVICRVDVGGYISSHKGVNFPGTELLIPSLMDKDLDDLRFGIDNDVDFVAVSFVRKADDLTPAFRIMEEKGKVVPLIPKIEKPEALDDIEEILNRCYGLMVARGDLGVECPYEKVPIIQKRLIALCNDRGKPVITATQMLDSMIRNPSPTRAEVTDVANAIFDGTDAVMLSGESASGKYPVEAVQAMNRIASYAEGSLPYENIVTAFGYEENAVDAISLGTCKMAEQMSASAIMVFTSSGRTALSVCRFRPRSHVIAFTDSQKIVRRLMLSWGVFPLEVEIWGTLQEMLTVAGDRALEAGLAASGDLTVVTAGAPDCMKSSTNMIMLYSLKELVLRGNAFGAQRTASGRAVVVENAGDMRQVTKGDVLILDNPRLLEGLGVSDISAIVTVSDRSHSRLEKILENSYIPVVSNVPSALEVIKTGMIVRVDGRHGLVSVSKYVV